MTSSSAAILNAPAADSPVAGHARAAGDAHVAGEGRRLSPAVAFLLLASLTASFLAGSSAPTPLYGVYMAEWGLTPLMITVIFGIYALAVLLALLVAGRLSDHLGRKPVLLTATLAQALTMVLFVTASGLTGLLVARVLQGLTTGAAVGAIGAAMIDLNKTRGTIANAVAPPFGTATGAIVAGVLVQFLPFPTHLVYVVFGLVFVVQAIGLAFMTDSIAPRRGVLASLEPQLRLPRATREPLLLATPVLVAVWALAGFYGALGPMLVRGMLGVNTPLISYIAMGVPAVTAGWLIAQQGNILLTAQIFGAVIMALACTALLGSVLRSVTKREPAKAG